MPGPESPGAAMTITHFRAGHYGLYVAPIRIVK
jgi:hypothetical protein